MWNKLNRLYLRSEDVNEKLKIKELMANLDTPQGKKEARAYIRQNSSGTWFSWRS